MPPSVHVVMFFGQARDFHLPSHFLLDEFLYIEGKPNQPFIHKAILTQIAHSIYPFSGGPVQYYPHRILVVKGIKK